MPGTDPAIRKLLAEVVDSIEKLEVLMRLSRRGPAGVPTIAKELGLPETMVGEAIAGLVLTGIVANQANGTYQYVGDHPRSFVLAELAKLYEEDRIVVFRLITQSSIERVRSEAARVFADAFVIRAPKKPKGDPDA